MIIKICRAALLFGLVFCAEKIFAQPKVDYPLIVFPIADTIMNQQALNNFFAKLYRLDSGSKEKLSIVHIGDSHLQADFFTGEMRRQFQHCFGNAGRGLVFPYKVAATNGPLDLHTCSANNWEAKRNVFPNMLLPIGVSGITIKTTDSAAAIHLLVTDNDDLDYGFTKLTLFSQKGPNSFDWCVTDTSNDLIGYINSMIIDDQSPFTTTIHFKEPQHEIFLRTVKTDSLQSFGELYGIELGNDNAGVEYSMIGVNGAMYEHYNQSEYFAQQLPALHPDLVIISLGTNDSYVKYFDQFAFAEQVKKLVSSVKSKCPDVAILLTAPGDNYRYRRYKNLSIPFAVEQLQNVCNEDSLAFWNFFQVMGGTGSMLKWKKSGYGQYDYLHFTRAGYELEAELLYDALMERYHQYLNGNHP